MPRAVAASANPEEPNRISIAHYLSTEDGRDSSELD